MTKWAAADVPVRVPSTVVTVPVERPGIRTVVHVTTRDDQPLVSLHPKILFISCSHFRRHPSGMIFPFYFSFAGRFHGGRESPMSPSKWLFPTKRAAADAPVRVPSTVGTVPVERPGSRTVVHVTTREDQLTAFGLIVVVREECA